MVFHSDGSESRDDYQFFFSTESNPERSIVLLGAEIYELFINLREN